MRLNSIVGFIYLNAYSSNGGIEKFNRSFIDALLNNVKQVKLYSLYDDLNLLSVKSSDNLSLFSPKKNKLQSVLFFLFQLVFKPNDILIVGHINLAIFGLLIKIIYPKKKLILVAHGIEVWGSLSGLQKLFFKKVDEVWAVSNFTKEKIIERFGFLKNKVFVFHNTLGKDFFPSFENFNLNDTKSKYQIPSTNKVLLTVSRLSSSEGYKGYDRVVESLEKLKIENVTYLIVGKYDLVEKERVEKIKNNLKIKNTIIFTGHVNDTDLMDCFMMADLFIMPSLQEGFGIVFIEALACGTPVIAGNVDGSVDALKNGELGLLVNPSNKNEITQAIELILLDASQKSAENVKDRINQVYQNFGFDKFQANQYQLLNRLD